MSKETTPMVELQSIFVRDQQRRLSLVIELLEREFRQKQSPPESSDVTPCQETALALAASTTHIGGQNK